MPTTVRTKWAGGMTFDADLDGHHILMDSTPQGEDQDRGLSPKPLLLAALAGCSGLDIVSILSKMQITEYGLEIVTEAESTTEHPVVYHTIVAKFLFSGQDLPAEKLIKAVNLSTERYCGVNAMLKKAANVIVKIYLNEVEILL